MQRFAVILFWSAAAFALIMASITPIALPGNPDDKFQHMVAFAVLALLGALAYPGVRLLVLLVGLSAFGALIELIQLIQALNRTADWTDLAADILAAAVVLCAIFVVRRIWERAAG